MLFAISALSASICAFVSYLCCYLGIVEIRVSSSSGSLTSTNKVIDYFGVEGAFSSYSFEFPHFTFGNWSFMAIFPPR